VFVGLQYEERHLRAETRRKATSDYAAYSTKNKVVRDNDMPASDRGKVESSGIED